MDIDYNSLDAKIKKKEDEIREMGLDDETCHAEEDSATINVFGEELAKLYDKQKRKQYGKEPNNQPEIAHEMAVHIKGTYFMESTEDQIAKQIINNSKTHLKDGYYDN